MSNFIELFKKQVLISSDATAIWFHDTSVTYQELNSRSDALAKSIVRCGVNIEEIIPLILERTLLALTLLKIVPYRGF